MYIMAGTQAAQQNSNKISAAQLSQLHKTNHDEDDSENDSDTDDEVDEDPVLEVRSAKHPGCVNRIKVYHFYITL